MKEKRTVKEGLSKEVALSSDWKDKEKTSYEQNEEERFQETALAKAMSQSNSSEIRNGRWPVWPEHGQ